MSIKRCLMVLGLQMTLLFATGGVCRAAFISNARSVVAYGSNGAYLITTLNEILQWNSTVKEWALVAKLTPQMRQLDCFTDGTKVIGTDVNDKVWLWNGFSGFTSSWSKPRGDTEYRWIQYDPVSDETKGYVKGLDAWESWNKPTAGASDPWNKYLPAEQQSKPNEQKTNILVDKQDGYHRWQENDIPYFVKLNLKGLASSPFNIYYYGEKSDVALSRITNPPIATHNIDDIEIKLISYDEDGQNLWSVGTDNKPYRWDNTSQQWILSYIKSDASLQKPVEQSSSIPDDLKSLLKTQNDYYVRTTYIDGQHRPKLIIFRDSKIMHLILGTLSMDISSSFIDIIIVTAKKRSDSPWHNLLMLPKETPQKIVHPDSNRIKKRIRENHYLERLLINNGIIANADALGVYPSEHMVIRR